MQSFDIGTAYFNVGFDTAIKLKVRKRSYRYLIVPFEIDIIKQYWINHDLDGINTDEEYISYLMNRFHEPQMMQTEDEYQEYLLRLLYDGSMHMGRIFRLFFDGFDMAVSSNRYTKTIDKTKGGIL